MLSSAEVVIENADEEIPLVIVKSFEMQSCVSGFHFL